ncbi:Serine/threonine-protein kinase PrkC [Posidoniimonas polymericola]|uniref:Serine/threonine-protein kinase PrkC n=1 Tax=Posidoniimonas polymericola TaxID=2528002 RepID=A0A5C5YU59_9BACT|nr:serine/threonine-protein kinase [Posidoniimonas polymericola]TWT78562.1 Serine/threonine-protein kinase PrkC [Posidoniimonas polymericola]
MSRDLRQPDDSSDLGRVASPGLSDIIRRLDQLWDEHPLTPSSLYDLEGQEIGGCRLLGVVGQGAFGIVYHARDEQGGRDVAIKVPRPEVVLHAQRMQRFRNEAIAAATLDHPAIVPVYATEFEGPAPHIMSEYIDGPDLGEWLARAARPVDFEPAVRFILKLVDAVQHAHGRGVTHRDLKPGNVLLQPTASRPLSLDDYSPRLTDFGLAGFDAVETRCTSSSMMIGTPLYMPPEQAAGGVADWPAADIYSLGVLLFELITKQTPYQGLTYPQLLQQMQVERAPDFAAARSDVPRGLQAIVTKCLRHDASDRYESAGELAADLARFLNGERPHAPPVRVTDPLVRWMRRPERLRQAALWTTCYQAGTIFWMCLVIAIAAICEVFPAGTAAKSVVALGVVCGLVHCPKALLGWAMLSGVRWAYPVSLLSSAVLLGVFIYSTLAESIAFEWNYPTRFSKVSNFSILILGSTIECGLHLLAWPAWTRRIRAGKSLS